MVLLLCLEIFLCVLLFLQVTTDVQANYFTGQCHHGRVQPPTAEYLRQRPTASGALDPAGFDWGPHKQAPGDTAAMPGGAGAARSGPWGLGGLARRTGNYPDDSVGKDLPGVSQNG